ncbi:MAG: repeat-containing protein [Verrucomicrobiales bacterium]|nr:repeat-containing protein [Verrucomicrobiales bacterium]
MSDGKTKFIFRIAVTLILLALVGLIFWLLPKRSDPLSYRGRSLSQWVEEMDGGSKVRGVEWSPLPQKTAKQLEAVEAIRAIGTNGLPFLLQELHTDDSFFYTKKQELLRYIESKKSAKNAFLQTPVSPAEKTRWRAALALESLGPLTESATNDLVKLLMTPGGSENSAKEAAFILGGIGPKGISLLTNCVRITNSWGSMCAIWSLGQHPAAATNMVPYLLKMSRGKDENVAYSSVWALGEIHTDPDIAVPALIRLLRDPRKHVAGFAAGTLGRYGAKAKAALPKLKEQVDDSPATMSAKEAIKKIEAAIAAEPKTTDTHQ